MLDKGFWNGRRVLLTGHTGFKGSWMCVLLSALGAETIGVALDPPTSPSAFDLLGLSSKVVDIRGDIRDIEVLRSACQTHKPEVVIHMAAQPIVRDGYKDPVGTYATNVMGTVNVLQAALEMNSVHSVVNVTTDKVYENLEQIWAYREPDRLDGYDPYSNSKSCSELVTGSYRRSFFNEKAVSVSTVRAGNVIGGGDFSKDRIIPDLVRSSIEGEPAIVRNPLSYRPYQHVLEPLSAYLFVAQKQWHDLAFADAYNVGPSGEGFASTARVADLFCMHWKDGARWIERSDNGPHEATLLRLDTSYITSRLGWCPKWSLSEAIEKTVAWYKAWDAKSDLVDLTESQIACYMEAGNEEDNSHWGH